MSEEDPIFGEGGRKAGPITLSEMITVCDNEANRICVMQNVLVQEGELKTPNLERIRTAAVYERISSLLRTMEPHWKQVRAFVKKVNGEQG